MRLSNTPSSRKVQNHWYTVRHGGKLSGKSRQGHPARSREKMASTISRIGQHRRRQRWLAQGLDDLLARRPGQAGTWRSWLRNAQQSPAGGNIRTEERRVRKARG